LAGISNSKYSDEKLGNFRLKIRLLAFLIVFVFANCAKLQLQKKPVIIDDIPNWNMWGGNIARTHVYPGNFLLPAEPVQRVSTSSAVGKTLLAVDGMLFYTTLDGEIHAYDLTKKDEIGHKSMDLHSTLVVQDSVLIIARRYGDDTLFGYNLNSGKIFWHINAGDVDSEPYIDNDQIVVTALYKHIDKYQIMTGERIWKTDLPEHIHSSPASDGKLIFFGCDDNFVYAVDGDDGAIVWKFQTNGAVQAGPSVLDSTVFVGSTDKFFYALDSDNGKLRWKFLTDGQILNGAAVNKSAVVFGTTDEHVYCLNPLNGAVRWKFHAGSVISTTPLICGKTIFFGSLNHFLFALNVETGEEIWKFKTRGRIRTDPIIWGKYLICASEDHDLIIFQSKETE